MAGQVSEDKDTLDWMRVAQPARVFANIGLGGTYG